MITYLLCVVLYSSLLCANTVDYTTNRVDDNIIKVHVTFKLQPQELLYKESLHYSVDNPTSTIDNVTIRPQAQAHYDNISKETKNSYKDIVTINFDVCRKESPDNNNNVHILYITNQSPQTHHVVIPLLYNQPSSTADQINNDVPATQQQNSPATNSTVQQPSTAVKTTYQKKGLTAGISSFIEKTSSLPLRLLLVFLLGVLLSLTPCIYPMIPITIGILQTQGSSSAWRNCIIAGSYTMGMATTFALCGLLAGLTGPICGILLMKPWFIIILITVLLYLALSMLGLYELRMPRFLQPRTTKTSGSLLSAFLFGVASGTIASPCVSPGLALLLSIVATLGNALLGFLLLFAFGVGLSTPLFIVGTFSSSLNLLPQAGMWMVEVKKFFGFMMIAMCLYYLSYIVPLWIVSGLAALGSLALGFYYTHRSIYHVHASLWKIITALLGISLIACSLLLAFQAYHYKAHPQSAQHQNDYWLTDYQQALQQAKASDKKIFVDCWAQFCSICLAINKKLFNNPEVLVALQEKFILLDVDGTHNTNQPYAEIAQKFSVQGFPTFLIIDPITETVIHRWGGELYSMTSDEFINLVKS